MFECYVPIAIINLIYSLMLIVRTENYLKRQVCDGNGMSWAGILLNNNILLYSGFRVP